MLKKFLRDAVVLVIGKQAEQIADLLYNKKHVNEFLIAKKLDLTINQTRNLLYKISDYGMVSFIRKKDKRKGWYTYFWRLEVIRSLEFYRGILLKRLEQVKNQIKSRETKQFYICERCNIELNEENALLYDFTCNECGDIFVLKDSTKLLKELKKNMNGLESELKFVDEEIRKEKENKEKVFIRHKKKEDKKTAKEKVAKRLVNKLAKEAVNKKIVKKVKSKVVKKVVKRTAKKVVKKKKAKKKAVKKKILKKKVGAKK